MSFQGDATIFILAFRIAFPDLAEEVYPTGVADLFTGEVELFLSRHSAWDADEGPEVDLSGEKFTSQKAVKALLIINIRNLLQRWQGLHKQVKEKGVIA